MTKKDLEEKLKFMKKERENTINELSNCGIFKGSKKKELKYKLEKINSEICDLEVKIEGISHFNH